MELIIRVTTPKGQASKTEKRIRKFILGLNKPQEILVNLDNNKLYWIVNTDPRRYAKIIRNLTFFDYMVKQIFQSKQLKKFTEKGIDKEGIAELKEMLADQTKVEKLKADQWHDEILKEKIISLS